MDPTVTGENPASIYSQYRYSGDGPGNHETGARLAGKLVNAVSGLGNIGSVCDLGCGNGYVAGRFLEKGYSVVGVDASESGVAVATDTYGARAEFVCASIDAKLPEKLGRERFDLVVSSDVIEHLYRPRDLLACARELLVPGGWLIVGTPYHGYLKNLVLSILDHWDRHHGVDWDGGHIKFFSVRTLRAMVRKEGFGDLRFSFFGRAPFLWMNMICVARKPESR